MGIAGQPFWPPSFPIRHLKPEKSENQTFEQLWTSLYWGSKFCCSRNPPNSQVPAEAQRDHQTQSVGKDNNLWVRMSVVRDKWEVLHVRRQIKNAARDFSVFNLLQTVSVISECLRFHKPFKKNQEPLKISFLKWKAKASQNLPWPLINL